MKVAREQIDAMSSKLYELHTKLDETRPFEEKIKYQQELTKNVFLFDQMEAVTPSNNVIGIGSKFRACVVTDGNITTDDYILSESDVPVKGYRVILTNCPLAKALMGKTVNDTVEFDVNSYKVVATVNEIYKKKIIIKTRQ